MIDRIKLPLVEKANLIPEREYMVKVYRQRGVHHVRYFEDIGMIPVGSVRDGGFVSVQSFDKWLKKVWGPIPQYELEGGAS